MREVVVVFWRYTRGMNIDFSVLPKTLCDTLSINFQKHYFLVAFTSGQTSSAFAVPPELMKAFMDGMPQKIAAYEEQFGTIGTDGLEGGIQSPIQMG